MTPSSAPLTCASDGIRLAAAQWMELAAVRILQRVRVQQGSEGIGNKKTGLQHQGKQVKEGKKREVPEPTLNPQQLLAEATPWATSNQQVMALLDAESAKSKPAGGETLGSTNPVKTHTDSVCARCYDDYKISFYGGEVGRVALVGDGDTDLGLIVDHETGDEITRDDDNAAECVVSFTPKWTAPFRPTAENYGRFAGPTFVDWRQRYREVGRRGC